MRCLHVSETSWLLDLGCTWPSLKLSFSNFWSHFLGVTKQTFGFVEFLFADPETSSFLWIHWIHVFEALPSPTCIRIPQSPFTRLAASCTTTRINRADQLYLGTSRPSFPGESLTVKTTLQRLRFAPSSRFVFGVKPKCANSESKALLSEEVYEFVKANAEELDKAIDYKRFFANFTRWICWISCFDTFFLGLNSWVFAPMCLFTFVGSILNYSYSRRLWLWFFWFQNPWEVLPSPCAWQECGTTSTFADACRLWYSLWRFESHLGNLWPDV